jgi:hypothetical protein
MVILLFRVSTDTGNTGIKPELYFHTGNTGIILEFKNSYLNFMKTSVKYCFEICKI